MFAEAPCNAPAAAPASSSSTPPAAVAAPAPSQPHCPLCDSRLRRVPASLLTVGEAAEILRLTPGGFIRIAGKRGILVRIGRLLRVRRGDLARLIREGTSGGGGGA